VAPPHITLIVARARNGVIGNRNKLPWRLPEDLQHFKSATIGHPLIMGRKTFDSIGKALPGRRIIVVTRQADWSHAGCERAGSVGEAIEMAAQSAGDEVFVAGGSEIFRQTLDRADRLLVTEVDIEPEGDTVFPAIDPARWRQASLHAHRSVAGLGYEIVEYLRA
jgi:dihydrofolate reductase